MKDMNTMIGLANQMGLVHGIFDKEANTKTSTFKEEGFLKNR